MMYAPVALCVVGNPVVFGSKGHRIIKCGPILMGGLVVSNGSESLRCVAPANMYSWNRGGWFWPMLLEVATPLHRHLI
jgi:hypothetical protein